MQATTADFVGAEALSQRVGLSRSTIYNRLQDGTIKSVWYGGRRLIPAEEADRFVEELRGQVR